jgi:hypothetical protein
MMEKAEKLAKAAREKGDRQAEAEHSRDARRHKTAMKRLNSKASKTIFKERNRVRGCHIEAPWSCVLNPCCCVSASQFGKD